MSEHPTNAGEQADWLIANEIEGQDKMWGVSNERAAVTNRQLMYAGMAQLQHVYNKQIGAHYLKNPPSIYPADWTGWRDYGSDVANLVVAAAFIRQEIKRLIEKGEDTTRTKRDYATQPYTGVQPAVQL